MKPEDHADIMFRTMPNGVLPMKRWGLALWVTLTIAPVLLPAQGKIPIIVFDSLTKDVGSVVEGQTLKHVFKFTNKGTALLEIIRAEGS